MNITECKGAEVQLKDYADKLAQSNRELEQFTCVVSDNLKAQLHAISTRLEFLTKSQETPNDNTQYQIERISLAIKHLEQLLNGLLFYSRAISQATLAPTDTHFQIFQRLHNQSEYEGSGISLSIVKRVIQQQGDYIWTESELGQGSKFFFTLKEASNAS